MVVQLAVEVKVVSLFLSLGAVFVVQQTLLPQGRLTRDVVRIGSQPAVT